MAGYAAAGAAALDVAGQAGLFGKPKQYGYSTGDIDKFAGDRNNEIDQFSQQLADMRSQYMAQIPQLNTATFNQFGADAAAKFGANGIGVDSGAFAASLAREALPLQAGMYNTAYTSGVSNANSVNNARQNVFSTRMGIAGSALSAPTQNPAWAALGNFAGQAGMSALYSNQQGSQGFAASNPGLSGQPGNYSQAGYGPLGPSYNPSQSWQ